MGAVGAFLKCTKQQDNHEKYSWHENYAHSSGNSRIRNDSVSVSSFFKFFFNLNYIWRFFLKLSLKFDSFELNQEEKKLVSCPLLKDPSSYVPDLIDLTKDEAARTYWLDCF